MSIELKTAELDGKRIAYCSDTEFLVQIGRGQSSYRTRYRIVGNIASAVLYYRGLNIGNGYKKRLLMPSSSRPVLAVARS